MKIRLDKIGKGVGKTVKNVVNDCGEFLRINTKIYIVLAATYLLDLHDPNASPAESSGLLSKENRQESFDKIALAIIDKYVLNSDYDPQTILTIVQETSQPERHLEHHRVVCGYPQCPKTFAVDGLVREKHQNICIYKDLMSLVR
jgi:hypothetical protein